jgi:hypothetical protein
VALKLHATSNDSGNVRIGAKFLMRYTLEGYKLVDLPWSIIRHGPKEHGNVEAKLARES